LPYNYAVTALSQLTTLGGTPWQHWAVR